MSRSLLVLALAAAALSCANESANSDTDVEWLDETATERGLGVTCSGTDPCSGEGTVYTSLARIGLTATGSAEVAQTFTATAANVPAKVRVALRNLRPFSASVPTISAKIVGPVGVDGALEALPVLRSGELELTRSTNGIVAVSLTAGTGAITPGSTYALVLAAGGTLGAGENVLFGVGTLVTSNYEGGSSHRRTARRLNPASEWAATRFRPLTATDAAFAFEAAPASLAASPTSLAFPQTVSGGASATQQVTITNAGGSSATIASVTSSDSTQFPITTTCGATLGAGAACSVTAQFTPVSAGSKAAAIEVAYGLATLSIAVSGTSVLPASLSASPSTHDFGSVAQGSTASTTITFTNGPVAQTLTSLVATGPYTVSGCTGELSANATCAATVTFTPTSGNTTVGAAAAGSIVGTWPAAPGGTTTATLTGVATSGTDPLQNKVILLMPMDGANGSTTFTDLAGSTVTPVASTVTTAAAKFGQSASFGAGGYLGLPTAFTNKLVGFANNVVTLEAWVHPTAFHATQSLAIMGAYEAVAANGRWSWRITNTGKLNFGWTTAVDAETSVTSTAGVPLNQWTHVAAVIDATTPASTTVRLYVGGAEQVFTGQNFTTQAAAYDRNRIGGGLAYHQTFGGYIDDLRITKGTARYTQPFSPPTSAHPFQPSSFTPSVTSVAFGDVPQGGVPARAQITFTNGPTDQVLTSLSVTSPYTVTGCSGIIAAGATCTATVTFAPMTVNSTIGTSYPATLSATWPAYPGGTSTVTFTASVVANVDLHAAKRILMMHMDGVNGGTSFPDLAGNTITTSGTPTTTTTTTKFGGASASFNGSSWLVLPASYHTALGGLAGNTYTVEAWINPSSLPAAGVGRGLIGAYAAVAANGRWFLGFNGNKPSFTYTTGTGSQLSVTGTQLIPTAAWTHLALVIDATNASAATVRLFVNGVGQTFTNVDLSTHTVTYGAHRLGGEFSQYVENYVGSLDEVRVTRGVQRYTSDFAPPTGAFPEGSSIAFPFLGVDQEWEVPAGVTRIVVKAWGAGGGGSSGGGTYAYRSAGGGGGFARGVLDTTPGERLTIVVGQGGPRANDPAGTAPVYGGGTQTGGLVYGAGGGGRSAVRRNGTELLTAGGGGGGGYGSIAYVPNAGGGTTGQGGGLTGAGGGGTASAGGASFGGAATQFQGGSGQTLGGFSCGGGGGGWWGGGGGAAVSGQYCGTGGGGSGYVGGANALGSTTAGSGATVANASDAAWATGAGTGGAAGPATTWTAGADGSHGRVVISW